MPAVELARCLRARELSVVEITRAFCERIETSNARVNAYVTTCLDTALEAAKSSDQRIAVGASSSVLSRAEASHVVPRQRHTGGSEFDS